ncbi:MarR family winged helix-turn-helix transcriptional regulator [Ancylobacter defluvii]|uniref:MarR family transcriptional regulator n=1 Tax=Ancylobacter defluvii TaxID=1282440 RepID=A0A9W6NA41_9HYPH|nr:MarR family transcriptional regulator [Ancylobacter defluvii]MBS7590044.1 MarR family transcriptional regulator [Ancylobacter defluvii]GLK83172.1 MarR family transcriptional regulator [Ancylobacter defluvii]
MSTLCHCTILRRATRKLSAVYDLALAPFAINIAQYSLLRVIAREQPLSLTTLGRRTELDRSTVGRNVRVLEKLGLVVTRKSEDDQREAVVALTAQGTDTIQRAFPAWENCQRDIEAKLGAGKIDTLRTILDSI